MLTQTVKVTSGDELNKRRESDTEREGKGKEITLLSGCLGKEVVEESQGKHIPWASSPVQQGPPVILWLW